jgi:hypothetical protein
VLAFELLLLRECLSIGKVLAGASRESKKRKELASSGDPPGLIVARLLQKPWNKVDARACEMRYCRPPGLLSSSHDLLGDRDRGPPFHAAERHIGSWPTRHSPGAPLPASLSQTKAAKQSLGTEHGRVSLSTMSAPSRL